MGGSETGAVWRRHARVENLEAASRSLSQESWVLVSFQPFGDIHRSVTWSGGRYGSMGLRLGIKAVQ